MNKSWIKWARLFAALGATAGAILTWYYTIKAWKEGKNV